MSATANTTKHSIMAHMISHYPDRETSRAVARALVEAGVSYLEVQFPFSDPSADGPAIQQASSVAIEAGFRVDDGFALLSEIASETTVPVYLMTYASLVVSRGVERFCRSAADAGVRGLIVPDLPFDYDEGLYAAGHAAGLEIVPVLVAGIGEERLQRVLEHAEKSVYVALRAGITGSETVLDDESLAFLDRVRSTGLRVFGGFGVRRREQVEALAPHLDAVVVGSQFVRTLTDALQAAGNHRTRRQSLHSHAEPGSSAAAGSGGAPSSPAGAVGEAARELVAGG